MARLFDISTTTDSVNLSPGGQAKIVFTVTNTTQKPVRGALRPKALDAGQGSWLKVSGETERDFSAGGTQQVELTVSVPAGTAPGRFRVRLDVVSVIAPEDDYTEGSTVSVVIKAADVKPPPNHWWIWVVIGVVVLIVIGAVLFLVLHKGSKKDDTPPPQPPASQVVTPPQPPQPRTVEFNDPRIAVPQGNLPLDVCREWATDCGKPAADAYCQSRGMSAATDFRIAADSPPTVIITSKQVCSQPGCDRITWVKCSERQAPMNLNIETLQQIQRMRGKNIQVK